MEFKDYYAIMGLDEEASEDDIKKTYRKLARKYHPDVSKEADAEQKFKDLGEAYEVLGDPKKREEYDQLKKMGGRDRRGEFTPPPGWESASHFSGAEGMDAGQFSDFFESVFGGGGGFHQGFGGGRQRDFSRRGEDVHHRLPVFLEQAYEGAEQMLELRVPVVDERGMVSHRQRRLKMKIPAGVTDGQTLRLRGQGAPGVGSGKPGDLLVDIQLAPHPLYTVSGKDISLVAPVAPWEAALGTKITVPTLAGKARVTLPAGSEAGRRLRLKGKGLPGSPAGDFFVFIKIAMPTRHSEKEQRLWEELAQASDFRPRAEWEDAS